MPCFTVLIKFCKQVKTIGGFWVGCGGLTCSLQIMEPGGSLEDDWKQVVVCDHTYFSIALLQKKLSLNKWCNTDLTRSGMFIAFSIIEDDANGGFYLHAQGDWLSGSAHTKTMFFEWFYIWNFYVKESMCLSLWESQYFLTFNPYPYPDPISHQVRPRLMKETPLFLSLRTDTWSLLTIQSYLFSIH